MTQHQQVQSLFSKQEQFLNKSDSLRDLFDKFQARNCFQIPEQEITINLDNITLSPDQYTVFISKLQGSNMRIIYYCLLYYIFERNPENKGLQMYERLLSFIYQHDLKVSNDSMNISDETAKVYFTKFLHSMNRNICKRKVIVEELTLVPQMDLLMVHLIRTITGQNDMILQINAEEIAAAFGIQLGFTFQFLTNQIFVFQGQYVVEIRHFSEECSFHIRHEKIENIQKMRKDLFMGKSANFTFEARDSDDLSRNKLSGFTSKFKVIKKSTAKSIGLESVDIEEDEPEKQQFLAFGGILMDNGSSLGMPQQIKLNRKQSTEEQDSFVMQFDKLINNSSLYQPKVHQKEVIQCNPQPERNFKKGKEIKQQEQQSVVGESTKSIKSTMLPRQTHDSMFFTETRTHSPRLRDPLVASQSIHNSSSFGFSTLSHCQSTKQIKSQQEIKLRKHQSTRIPTFIMNRVKAKEQNLNRSTLNIMNRFNQSKTPTKVPKITFTYQKA